MSFLAAAWRILADTAVYRLRKREGGNLVTSLTLAFALALPFPDLLYRFGFGVLLNLWVYLVNDCFDVRLDLEAPHRDHARVQFLADHLRAGIFAAVVLAVVLLGLALGHSLGLVLALGVTIVVIITYSAIFKRLPVLDIVSMGVWGVSMGMVGAPLESSIGLKFVGLLGILCMVTEAVQVIRDRESDARSGIRTSAVVFGDRKTAWVARGLIVCAALYGSLLLHRFWSLLLVTALWMPLDARRANRSWDAFRLIFGLTWLVLLGATLTPWNR